MNIVLFGIPLSNQGLVKGASIAPYSLRLYCEADRELALRVEIAVVDAVTPRSEAELIDEIAAFAPDVVGFNCYLWNRTAQMALAAALRTRFPQLVLIAGGPDVGPVAERALAAHSQLDAVCVDEGEEALRLMLRRMVGLDAEDWRNTPGFAVRSADGVRKNPPAPPVDMDAIPSLQDDRDWAARYPTLFVQTSRGCHFACSFCLYNHTARQWRSLDLIREEIARWVGRGGTRVDFIDAGINQDRGRFRALLQMLADFPTIERPIVEMNVELLNREDAPRMTGTIGRLAIGLQSANTETNRNIRRGFRLERFRDRIAAVREAGIEFSIDLVYGLPGDDYAAFASTLDEAYAMNPTLVHPFRLQILPGSTLESETERWGLRCDPEPWYWLRASTTFSAEDMGRAARLAQLNDLLHTFTFRATAFEALRSATERGASALIEQMLDGAWRGRPVTDDELARWADSAHLGELEEALRAWVAAAVAGSAYPERLSWVSAAWELQFGMGRALIAAHVAVPADAVAWPPEGSARPRLSPNAAVVALPERPGEHGYVLICRGPDEVVDLSIASDVASALARLDGQRDFDAVVAPLVAGSEASRDAWWARFGRLTELGMVWWETAPPA